VHLCPWEVPVFSLPPLLRIACPKYYSQFELSETGLWRKEIRVLG
jgi:hypothetical protein